MKLPKTLPQPKLPKTISENAKWLAGEGAGSWFIFSSEERAYSITRYSPKGIFECKNKFDSDFKVDLTREFSVTYPSHCAVVHIIQEGKKIKFTASI
ncbi:MAG: DUF6695 family protein [Flavobacteriales bacterium]|nr:hypothetical protein [Crocinitomicaceae bacterium]